MIKVDKTVLSDDLIVNDFVCNLSKCKGACCEEGDLGAPLEKQELRQLSDNLEEILPFLSEAGRAEIAAQGAYILDFEGDFSTPTIKDRECAYAVRGEKNEWKCGIENAFLAGKSTFHKPISCHLYPIRVTKYKEFEALNYDRWDICVDACILGESLQVPVYKFLKGPLVRKYGEAWFEKLEAAVKKRKTELGI